MRQHPLRAAIDEALALLAAHAEGAADAPDTAPRTDPAPQAPLRTLHHLACTGGTLIARCLAAMPNVRLLSEVDPLSTLDHGPQTGFFPSDLPGLARTGSRPPGPAVLQRIFLAGLAELEADSRHHGLHLVLRDHAHSHFCDGPAIPDRPTLHEILAPGHRLYAAVTVRHPFDAWLGMAEAGWLHFTPTTLDEYARRAHAFLDRHAGLEVLRYEDFVADPEAWMQRLCTVLALPFDPDFRTRLPGVRLSGDSGRTGDEITPRPRRAHPPELAEAARASRVFTDLLDRLGYPAP